MSIRGFLHFGGHRGLLYVLPGGPYGGERKVFDIGEDHVVGVLLTLRGDRQVHPLEWYDKSHPQVKKALLANRTRKSRPRPTVTVSRPRPRVSRPRPVL